MLLGRQPAAFFILGVCCLGTVLLYPDSVRAQSITATVERSQITIEDQLLLTLTVEGAQVVPELPALPDFRVVPRGSQQKFELINGRARSSVVFNYLLIPLLPGEFTIGAAKVTIDGKDYESRPFTVKVLDASSRPAEDRALFVTASVEDSSPYVGEQVVYVWRFFRRLGVSVEAAQLTTLEFGDLVSEDLGDTREYVTTTNGVQYTVSEIRKALFPQRAGKALIPASELQCRVAVKRRGQRRSLIDEFFGGNYQLETKILRTKPIELDIKALPSPPVGFSGLVGQFDIQARMSKLDLKVGESSTLELVLSGVGNVQQLSEPSLPALADFKIYDDQPSVSIDRSGNRLSARKTYKKALVPLKAGESTVPSIPLIYFDPKEQIYRTARTAAITLDILPGEGKEELMLTEALNPNAGKVAVRILADDILPIRRGLDSLESRPLRSWRLWFWQSGWLLPPLAFLALAFVRRRQDLLKSDESYGRRREALRRAKKELASLRSAADARGAAEVASRCLRGFIGDKLGLEGAALTAAEAGACLAEHGLPRERAREVERLLERWEALQYGSGGRATASPAALESQLKSILERLATEMRG